MESDNPNLAETVSNVKTYLAELFEEDLIRQGENSHFNVRYGSTVIEISVNPYGPEEISVTVMAYCVQGVEVAENLLLGLLELNHTLPFGAFSLAGTDIYFSYAIFGRTLERRNLLNAIAAVANIADEYDDLIVAKYGGERALDRIRATGDRRRREVALVHD